MKSKNCFRKNLCARVTRFYGGSRDEPRNPCTINTFDFEEFKPRKHELGDIAYAIAAYLLGVQVTKLGILTSTLH
ncbi:hypothetical protein YN1HA_30960 [Sulfurisphaera ohwakuensis]